MKMTLLTILILFFTIPAFCPGEKCFYIERQKGINYYDPLIRAIVLVESNGNKYAFNASEGAVGAFQIRECRLEHYNRLTGLKFVLNDMYDYSNAKQVFLYFAQNKSYEQASRDWNGKWSLTKDYWNKVQKVLLSQFRQNDY
jgi:hypothetical protein